MPEFTDAHGIAIVYDVHPAKTSPRAVVQLVHGVGEHSGRYAALIEALTSNGYSVYAGDLRGHGRTGMKQHGDDVEKLGRLGPGGVAATLAAVWHLSQVAREENPGLPLVVLGHSGGSFLTQKLINEHSDGFDGFILSGSALRMPGWLRTGGHNKPWDSDTSTGVEWLASDPAVGAAFLDDPLTTDKSPLELFGPIEVMKIMGMPRKNLHDLPLLLLVGRDDTVGGPRSVHKLADTYRTRSGLTDITTLVYPGARHEIFNEVMQADVRADVLAWLDKRFPARD
ncbi:alpha/beta hydrolase [Microbacterium sp. NPDC019599]|uniref:alpha/beta hydrolase n=1 Tax=Microbacterium sp. NPDC019599 TaxID=3154690 RepID=UPI003405041C